jgi:hypothetical protein
VYHQHIPILLNARLDEPSKDNNAGGGPGELSHSICQLVCDAPLLTRQVSYQIKHNMIVHTAACGKPLRCAPSANQSLAPKDTAKHFGFAAPRESTPKRSRVTSCKGTSFVV